MDAQTLFRDGVLALREKHDAAQARRLLTESLKLDPNNEMAWLWLSRTTDDPGKKLQCVERALRLNPKNQQALALKEKLSASAAPVRPAVPVPAPEPAALTSLDDLRDSMNAPVPVRPAARDLADISTLLADADRRLKAGDAEGAVESWVRVLEIQVDQPVAIQNAVQQLYKLGYQDDAAELLQRAIDGGTTSVPIYLTAIDLARAAGAPGKADSLREQVTALPTADEDLILRTVEYFIDASQYLRATELLEKSLETHPDNKALLLRMAELHEQMTGDKAKARTYYERVAQSKTGKLSKSAEKALSNFTPVVTDRERGSVWLALREAVGFGIIFVLLGWQDAGLDLMRLGPQRWLGIGLSILGGYLLVTGLSAPQQKPLAGWLGGKVPAPKTITSDDDPETPTALPILPGVLRGLFALAGGIVLVGAFLLVFSTSVGLLRHPVPLAVPSIFDLISKP